MGQKTADEVTRDALKEGGVLALLYFDLHAGTKEAVKNIMVGFLGKLMQREGVIYALGEIEEVIENNGLFSTSAEVKLLARDFPTLLTICAEYSPIGIEILKPNEIKLNLGDAQGMLLNVATLTNSFTRMLLEKVMTPEEKALYGKKLAQREELGRKLLEKKGE
jgi:hypothetical protein